MYQSIFKRVEEKYILTDLEKKKFFEKIEDYMEKDKYYESIICNLYFDTSKSDLIVKSLDKPIFKEKIRLRSYGIPTLESDVFLEKKEKYNGVVGKRRLKIKLKDFYEYMQFKKMKENNQIMKEIDYCFKYYNLKPSIFIAYNRKSYVGKNDKSLRITVDENLRSRRSGLKLEFGDMGKNFFDNKMYLLEIKTLNALPLWLVRILSELKIYPKSFSKYGNIYMKEINHKEELKYVD